MRQRLTLPFPPSLNNCFVNAKGVGRIPSQRYKAWTTEALWMLKAQRAEKMAGDLSIHIGLVAPDKRARDGDNLIKPALDILVKAGIIADDSNKHVRRVSVEWLASGEPCVVIISQYMEEAA